MSTMHGGAVANQQISNGGIESTHPGAQVPQLNVPIATTSSQTFTSSSSLSDQSKLPRSEPSGNGDVQLPLSNIMQSSTPNVPALLSDRLKLQQILATIPKPSDYSEMPDAEPVATCSAPLLPPSSSLTMPKPPAATPDPMASLQTLANGSITANTTNLPGFTSTISSNTPKVSVPSSAIRPVATTQPFSIPITMAKPFQSFPRLPNPADAFKLPDFGAAVTDASRPTLFSSVSTSQAASTAQAPFAWNIPKGASKVEPKLQDEGANDGTKSLFHLDKQDDGKGLFSKINEQVPSKVGLAVTSFFFNTTELSFGAPVAAKPIEHQSKIEVSFADVSKMEGLKQEVIVSQVSAQASTEASKTTEDLQAEVSSLPLESTTEDVSIIMEDDIAEDAAAPPEDPVATPAASQEPGATPIPSKVSGADLAPPLEKVEQSSAPAAFVFKPQGRAAQLTSEFKKVTFDPLAWASGGVQSFAFVSKENDEPVEAVRVASTAAASKSEVKYVGSKSIEDDEPAALPDVAVANINGVSGDTNTAEPEVIEDPQAELSEPSVRLLSSPVASQENASSPISSTATDSDEHQDLVSKLEALQSSIALLEKVGLNDEVANFAQSAEQTAVEEVVKNSGMAIVPEEKDLPEDMDEPTPEQDFAEGSGVEETLEQQQKCTSAPKKESPIEYDAEPLENLAFFGYDHATGKFDPSIVQFYRFGKKVFRERRDESASATREQNQTATEYAPVALVEEPSAMVGEASAQVEKKAQADRLPRPER